MVGSRFRAPVVFAAWAACWWSILLAVACAADGPSPATRGDRDVVRQDWYFRESLPAIRDWETILAWWEERTPGRQRTPLLPVPESGAAVDWPNPLPRRLLPAQDQRRRVVVRAQGEGAQIEQRTERGAPSTQTVAWDAAAAGYQHPGGGGSDQWYHHYHRRFDQLTAFRPRPAPLALRVEGPPDWLAGDEPNRLLIENLSERPLKLDVRLRLLTLARRDGRQRVDEARPYDRQVTIAAHATEQLPLPALSAPGGAVLLVSVNLGQRSWWLPLLAHVEDVPALVERIERLLAAATDREGPERVAGLAEQVAALRRRAAATRPGGTAWRELFEEASALRDSLLLRRIDFQTLLFVARKPFYSEQPFMDAHHCYNRPGGAIFRLSPVRPGGAVAPVVDSLGLGIYRDLSLHWNADRLLFSFGNGSDRVRETTRGQRDRPDGRGDYDLYEVAVDGGGLRRLTSSRQNDCEPFYLPDGQIGFTSDRSAHYVMCGSDIHVANLHVMDADGSRVRQLSFNVFNEFTPAMLPDGRILYSRWEYNERSVTSLHKLFTIHPDGTHAAPYYGNATIRPNVTMFGRPVPSSHKVAALLTAHHGQTHGPIGLVDPLRGGDGPAPLDLLTPDVPVTGEKVEESFVGWFSDPVPLAEDTYLCSYTPTAVPWLEDSWGIYLGDRHGNLALIHRDPHISVAEPVPIVRRPAPAALAPPSPATDAQGEAELLVLDATLGLPGVAPGTVKAIRVLEDLPRKGVPTGGVITTSLTPIYTAKRVLGTVPVAADGSAYFVVPANRNLYFAALDGRGREIQRMRSVLAMKPGERRTCVGCHEPRSTAPPNRLALAMLRPAARPVAPPWQSEPLSFRRHVQPVLDAHCAGCHAQDRKSNRVILTDDLTDQFSIGYEELVPYLSVAAAKRWDHPDDVLARQPYTYGSNASRLVRLLDQGHHGVQLSDAEWLRLVTWIDANGVYYDRYESAYPDRHIFGGEAGEQLAQVYQRRCQSCHGAGERAKDGRHDTWWLSLNPRDPAQSRALLAPLARQAAGWQRCPGPVFASTDDPDYRLLRQALQGIGERLRERPREDLLSDRASPRDGPR